MKRSERLKAKYLELVAKSKGMIEAAEKRENKDFTDQESKDFDALTVEMDGTFKAYEQALKAEKAQAGEESVPTTETNGNANQAAGAGELAEGEREKLYARTETKMETGQKISLIAASVVKAKLSGGEKNAFQVLSDEGFPQFALDIQRGSRNKSSNTLTPAAGGVLLPTPLAAEVVPFLRPETTFLQLNPVRVPLTAGQYNQPVGATGAVAQYVGEGQKKPVTDVTFDKLGLKAKKLAAIILLTKEAKKWTIIDIQAYIERELRNAGGQTLDLNGWLGTGANADTPTGILNVSGVGVVTHTFADPKAPTLKELDAAASKLILYMTLRFIPETSRWAWVMNPRTLRYLADMRVGAGTDGEYAFSELQGENPRWKGKRVLVSTQIPANLGTGLDESILALVNADDVIFGEEEDVSLDFSMEATIDVGGTLVHLFQQNMWGVLMEMAHDFGLRRKASVVRLNSVRWGAP